MVTVEELLFRQGQLETEVLCLQDALNRLTQRIFILESFIKHKHGDLALDETVLLSPGPGPEKENEDYSFVGDFSDLFVANPDVGADGTQTHEIIITTKPQQMKDNCSNNSSQSVPDLSVEDVESRSDIEEQEEQENVPDAVREETVSVSGASVNVMDVSVYDGDSISGQINLMGNDVEDYTEVVTYNVIPTSMVYDDQQPSSDVLEDNSPLLPPNKHAGTIRIYKPELKSFTRIPNGVEPSEDSTEDDPKHQCSVCHKVFIQKENMHRHMLLHSVVRFRCDECDRDFNNVHNLNLHKGKHQRQKERKEKADAEKQSARKTDNLNSSSKSGDFKCTYCGLSFATKSRKTGHERTHTTMKPFACDICGLSFRSKSGLADHTIGHSGQRSHLCHICPAGFLRSRNLLKHIRFVHSLVQIKTVLDGKRIVEFVNPEQADILIEQRKHNVESPESKAERATSCKTSNSNNSNNYSKTDRNLTEPQSRIRLQRSSASKSSKTNTSTITRSKRSKKISDNAISKINSSSSRKVEYLKRKSRVLSAKQDKDAIKANSININNRDSIHIQVNNNSSEDELTEEEALLLSKNISDIMVNMDEGENELIDQDILDHIKSEPEDYEDEDDHDL